VPATNIFSGWKLAVAVLREYGLQVTRRLIDLAAQADAMFYAHEFLEEVADNPVVEERNVFVVV